MTSIRFGRGRIVARVLAGLGLLALVLSVAATRQASPAHAWEGSCFDYAPEDRPWTELVVDLRHADIDDIAGPGQVFTDGTLAVTVSNPTLADVAAPATSSNIGAVDFVASRAVDAVYVRAAVTGDRMYQFYPPAPVLSARGIASRDAKTPIDWLSFCYAQVETAAATSTTVPPTTVTAAPTPVAPAPPAAPVVPEPSSAEPAVLAATETQAELAFTGDRSGTLAAIGVAMLAFGSALELLSRRSRRAVGRG